MKRVAISDDLAQARTILAEPRAAMIRVKPSQKRKPRKGALPNQTTLTFQQENTLD